MKVNGDFVKPRPIRLIFDKARKSKKETIRPYIFKTKSEGVEVFLTVGFTRRIPSVDELMQEQKRQSIRRWTRDGQSCAMTERLYCDRSELTGWGEAGSLVPHPIHRDLRCRGFPCR